MTFASLRQKNHNLDFAKFGIVTMFFLHALIPTTLYGRFGALVNEFVPSGTDQMLKEEDITLLLLSLGIGTIACILIGAVFLIRKMNNKWYSILAALVTGTGIIFTGACLLTGSHLSLLYLSLLILGCGIGLRIIHINKISMTYAHTSNEVVIPFFHSFYSLGSILALLLCLGLSFIPQNTIGLQYVITGAIVMCLEITVSFVWVPHPYLKEEETQGVLKRTNQILKNRIFLCSVGIIFAAGFCTGVGNQRIEISLIEELGQKEWIGTIAFVMFISIVMILRFSSRWFLKKINKLYFLLFSFLCGIVGMIVLMCGGDVLSMFIAIVLWAIAISCSYSIALDLISRQPTNENTESTITIFISEAFATCIGPLFGLFIFIGFPYYFFILIVAFLIGIISTFIVLHKTKQ